MDPQFAPTLSLAGRTAIVTGASRGIGRAIVTRLHKGGALVAALGRTAAQLESLRAELGEGVVVAVLDVGDRAQVDQAVPQLAQRLGGRIDIVVNNAGVGGATPLDSSDDGRWQEMLRTNISALMYVTRAALPYMGQGGRIVSTSSVLGKFGVPGYGGYCATKHAVIGWTRAVALELAPRGITANAICPGWVETDMAFKGMADTARLMNISAEEFQRMALSNVPQKRFLAPAEVAELVAFLASPAAAGITGEAIAISAGTTPHA